MPKRTSPPSKPAKLAKGNDKKARPVSSSSEEPSSEESDSNSDSSDELDTPESEDELDTGDYQEEEATPEAAEGSDVPSKPKQTSKEQHAEQKKNLAERKLQRKSGAEVQQIKRLWEKLRVKNPPMPKEIRDKLSNEVWDLAKGCIADLVMKHDASRVVQTLVKYSSKERREAIVESLKGNYYLLATSAYGKYLLVKLLHYGSKNSRELILKELHGKLRKLMRHREGAYVVEDLYVLYATQEQKRQMIREFWGTEYAVFADAGKDKDVKQAAAESTEKRALIARNLQTTVSASVEKGSAGFQILHAVMREYVQIAEGSELRELIDLLAEQFAELVHTQEGAEVACTLISRATAKERKQIIRALKPHAIKLATNEYGNLVLITLFMTVDDTVLVSKSFSSELAPTLHTLVCDKFSRRPFIYLLNGLDPHFFSPLVKKELLKYEEMAQETSKKPIDQRRAELLGNFAPSLFQAVAENPVDCLSENIGSQFVQELLLNDVKVEDLRQQVVEAVLESFKGNASEEDHLIAKPFSSRLLRSLVQGGRWSAKEKSVVKVDASCLLGLPFAVKFVDEIFENGKDTSAIKQWLQSPGSFVVVSLYEVLKEDSSKVKSHFFKSLKKLKEVISEEAEKDNKGAQLLSKLL